ncbi:MAG: ATP-dependent DNA helicase [Pseudomonadota bacterium]
MDELSRIFAPNGLLAGQIPNYAPRRQQEAMARAVTEALRNADTLVVEAGTGTGKTFAYLIPVLLSGKRVLISTGTKTLQDQLFDKDLPMVAAALGLPVRLALLKGRANYLCKHRFKLQEMQGRFPSKKEAKEFSLIQGWARETKVGDIAEVTRVSEQSPVWSRVTSTAENCLGQDCADYHSCHVVKARRQAQEAQVVVVNHHLLLADFAIRDEGFGELLPDADAIVVDEAHQLIEVATRFFGVNVSSRQTNNLVRDVKAESLKIAEGFELVEKAADLLDKKVADARLAVSTRPTRLNWDQVARGFLEAVYEISLSLQDLVDVLDGFNGQTVGIDHCRRRAVQQIVAWNTFLNDEELFGLRWVDVTKTGFVLHVTPFEVASNFKQFFASMNCAWVLTSATLAVEDDFSHYVDRLGAEYAVTLKLDSPFDFANNALLYLPKLPVQPNAPEYTTEVLRSVEPLISAAGGRTFLLFTSHRALNEAARLLQDRFEFPLLVQGSAPRDELLNQFREMGNAVLLGTSSFWEGVDVRGDALVLVVIDKLPFASPGDPILQARLEAIKRDGGQPFMEFQLPQAVISLKQGVGRLIRDVTDQGVVVLCDPRVTNKGYGKTFLASLPPMTVTQEVNVATGFLSAIHQIQD